MQRISLWTILIIGGVCLPAISLGDTYRTYSEVISALSSLQASRPDIVKVIDIGTSVEGRTIRAVKISDNPNIEDATEPDVLIVGDHHAREWISVEVPLRIAEYLVNNYDNQDIFDLVNSREIWFVPLVNPDGYEHSRDVFRLWRKNRRDLGFGFFGVDLNRNYGFQFGGPGSSGQLFRDTYRGPNAFSEPETKAIRDLINSRNFTRSLSYHSYSQLILYPWGYTTDKAPDSALLRSIAEQMQSLIEDVHGKRYAVQQASQLYEASGDLDDWAYGEKGILAYTIELRPPSNPPGFVLPESEIISTFEENLPAALFFIGLSRGRVLDFEDGTDTCQENPFTSLDGCQKIRSTIPGMQFTTTAGFDWIYGDQRRNFYSVQAAPDPSGPFASRGNLFGWLGPNQGLGQIDFVDGGLKTVGFSYSSASTTFLEGYDSSGNLIDSASGPGNLSTGRLDRLAIQGEIARVLVHDTGNFWLIDDLFVNDALSEAQAQLPGKMARKLQVVESYINGQNRNFQFVNDNEQFLNIVLQWPGSEFGLRIVRPDGSVFADQRSQNPPIKIEVENAEPGTWNIEVTALEVADGGEPAALVVGTFNSNDVDDDGIFSNEDNCPVHKNPDQIDNDGDGVGDACDNCPSMDNPSQEDVFPLDSPEGIGNSVGDACETIPDDMDEDGFDNVFDNCPTVPNPDQTDEDEDGLGNVCENCPMVFNPDQIDSDGDGIGDACEDGSIRGDLDGDGDVDRNDLNVIIAVRNMPVSDQDAPRDLDGDGIITAIDARKLILLCTRPRCATE
jgi:hypothetical protein